MPSVGMPSSKMRGSTRGAPSAYTDAGPPLRTTACGLRARTCSAVTSCPTSSEYTRHSRTRRAISCAYCPPRSSTRTGRSSAGRSGRGRISALPPVIRRLFRDRDVVRMALAQPGRSDPDELRTLHFLDRRSAAVAHCLPQPTDELVEDARKRTLVRDTALDALGNELFNVLDVALEVAVTRGASRAHGAERAHAAVLLEALSLLHDDVAGTLVGSCKERARHHGIRPRRDRLRDIAGRRHSTVGDQRNAAPARNRGAVVDRGDLGDPHARDNSSCAN